MGYYDLGTVAPRAPSLPSEVMSFLKTACVFDLKEYTFATTLGGQLLQRLLRDSTSEEKKRTHFEGESALLAVFGYVNSLRDSGLRRVPNSELVDRLRLALGMADRLFGQRDFNVEGLLCYGGLLRGKLPETARSKGDKDSQGLQVLLIASSAGNANGPEEGLSWQEQIKQLASQTTNSFTSKHYQDAFGAPYRYGIVSTIYPFSKRDHSELTALLDALTKGPYLGVLKGVMLTVGGSKMAGPPAVFFNTWDKGLERSRL